MLTIDTNEYHISLTRGDEATIEFSAKTESGETYLPESGDVLNFAVVKKWGGDPVFTPIENVFDECFEPSAPTEAEFTASKSTYFTKSGTTYNRCTDNDAYVAPTQQNPYPYYINNFWNIYIAPSCTDELKFGDYFWDIQVNDFTIIGKTDDVEPKFTVWGEA